MFVLSVIILSVIILSVFYAECHYAECRYAECCGAIFDALYLHVSRLEKLFFGKSVKF